jgi:hypothetical protein
MGWINPHRDGLLRRYADRFSANQFAEAWGTTRNAVLGRAFRLGVSLRKAPTPRVITPRSGRGRGRPPVFTNSQRSAAVAAVLAGATYRRAARLIGASDCSVWNWSRNPETLGAAYRILAMAKADACQRRAA